MSSLALNKFVLEPAKRGWQIVRLGHEKLHRVWNERHGDYYGWNV